MKVIIHSDARKASFSVKKQLNCNPSIFIGNFLYVYVFLIHDLGHECFLDLYKVLPPNFASYLERT